MCFIGRERELARIKKLIEHKGQQNALVYGRRRVGKSALLKQALQESSVTSIYYECRQTSEKDNINGIMGVLTEALGCPPLAFDNFHALLEYLFDKASSKNMVLVIDEYSYLRDAVAGLDSIFQSAIDAHRESSRLKIILCGSYVNVMKSLLTSGNPLYGRFDLSMQLAPMDYYDAAKFYPSFSSEDKVRLYSIFGGIPYYNRLINQNASVRENIIELVTEQDARLENEIPLYLNSELSKMTNANEVFGALSQGYSKWRDLLDQSHVSSGQTMTDVLSKLIAMELVQRQAPINDPQNKRKAGYFICDQLALFYYRYVFRYVSQRQVLDPEVFFDRYVRDDFEEWYVPHMFEEVCKQYLIRQNRAGSIEPAFDLIGKYWYDDPKNRTNGEFDIVTQDPQGYVFYEAKFRKTPLTQKQIQEEINQVNVTGLTCRAYGFISHGGFKGIDRDDVILIGLEELYK